MNVCVMLTLGSARCETRHPARIDGLHDQAAPNQRVKYAIQSDPIDRCAVVACELLFNFSVAHRSRRITQQL